MFPHTTEASNHPGNNFQHARKYQTFVEWFAGGPQASNHSGNDFRQARKSQTIRETTSARRGNLKPFGKRLSPSAETPNHLGSDFRHARKLQTIRDMTFAIRGNAKPLGKWLSPCAEMPNLLRNDLREARKGYKRKKHSEEMYLQSALWKEAATYSPALHCSTIGASGLNFSVRNGKRWDPTAITTWCIF